MEIEGYGITLLRLTRNDIEFLREKRNLPEVNEYMEYREHITSEAQKLWFEKINNEFNNYFLIEYNGQRVGLISGAEINWEKKITGNGGLFFWDTSYWGTTVPVCASFLLTEISFLIGFRKIFIRTLHENVRAVEFNKAMGYVKEDGHDKSQNQLYSLTPENFDKATLTLRNVLRKKYPKFSLRLFQPFDSMSQRVYDAVRTANSSVIDMQIIRNDGQ